LQKYDLLLGFNDLSLVSLRERFYSEILLCRNQIDVFDQIKALFWVHSPSYGRGKSRKGEQKDHL